MAYREGLQSGIRKQLGFAFKDISEHLPGAFIIYRADGTYFSVLDHGRIVESPQYGKVFYVLFMDWKDMHIRYNDKFAR